MNSVDKDIEQFEQNLIEINTMKDQIFELKNSLNNMLDETTDINKIKEGVNKELDNIHKFYENSETQIKNAIKSLGIIAENVKTSFGKDTYKIVNELNKFERKNLKRSVIFTVLLIINIIVSGILLLSK